MFAVLAAVLFGVALIFQVADKDMGPLLTTTTLTTAGLLCLALQLAGVATSVRPRWRSMRR